MQETLMFYIVFLSQVVLISFYLPRQVLQRMRFVVATYPPTTHPRLYPVSVEEMEKAQRNYRNLNLFALLVGLGLVAMGISASGDQMLPWDTGNVLTMYFFVQFLPLIVATRAGFTYFNPKRAADSRSTRTADLRRRRLFDYVSPAFVGIALFVYSAFVLFIIYIEQFGFPWFGGYLNIVGITAIHGFFGGMIVRLMYGKRKDPYQASEDRERQIELGVKSMIFVGIAATLFVMLEIGLHALDLQNHSGTIMSLYFQLIALVSFREFRIEDTDFEVYRPEPVVAQ